MSNRDDLRELVRSCWEEASECCPPRGQGASSCCEGSAEATQTQDEPQATDNPEPDRVRQAVRERYAEVSEGQNCCAEGTTPSCCDQKVIPADDVSARLGYSEEELGAAPEGANMGLGCGNPQAIADLKPGETVVDLGSGGGFDCFLAARQVGEAGRVVGIDMTPEMIGKARENAGKGGYRNVEFRLGEIEHLPVADESVDVVISNCVINLSPDKPAVYRDAFRVLKPGGRLAVSDVVRGTEAEFPAEVRNDLALIGGCVAGAASVRETETMLEEAGFHDIRVQPKDESREFIREWAPGRRIEEYIAAAAIQARKPGES